MKNESETLANEYYTAFGERDFEVMGKLLDRNVEFIGPMAELRGKEAVLESSKNFSSLFTSLKPRAVFGKGDEAVVVYDVECPAPIGTVSSSTYMKFGNGLITRLELFYNALPFVQKKDEIFS